MRLSILFAALLLVGAQTVPVLSAELSEKERAAYEARIEALKAENDFLKARQEALDKRMIELEEMLARLDDRLEQDSSKRRLLTTEERRKLDEALDVADDMYTTFSTMMKQLREDAEELAKKVPEIIERSRPDPATPSQ